MTNRQKTTAPGVDTHSASLGASLLGVCWVAPRVGGVLGLVETPIEVGRDPECNAVLDGEEVSRRHATLFRDGPLWIVEDRGSRNGTFANGVRIDQAPIDAGDVLRFGDCVGVVVRLDDPGLSDNAFGRIAENLYGGNRLRQVMATVKQVAASNLPVVIQGETGTGKESVARAVHAWSGRTGPFLAMNCAALPQSLAEAQLFGYQRGAFTGADHASPGHFRAAHGGTLFLDEVADLPRAIQPKLLRALEQSEVTPLGGVQPVPADVRVICSVQQSLGSLVEVDGFRSDLFARLNGYAVEIPPLRERIEDVVPLFRHFLAEESGNQLEVESRCLERLCMYDYPLNVRELLLLARQLVVLHRHESVLKARFLPIRVREFGKPGEATRLGKKERKDTHEFELLVNALRQHRGNVSLAARSVGLSRQRAYRLLEGNREIDLTSLRESGPG